MCKRATARGSGGMLPKKIIGYNLAVCFYVTQFQWQQQQYYFVNKCVHVHVHNLSFELRGDIYLAQYCAAAI